MASIKFFDSHIHIYTGHEGKCTRLLDSGHVDGMNLILLTPKVKGAEELNKEGYALKKKYPNRVRLAYWIDCTAKGHIKATEKVLKEHPEIDGLKVHPSGDKKEINERNFGGIFDLAKERGLYVITHTDAQAGCSSICFNTVMKKRRDLRLILGHSSTIEESIFMAISYENCYCEPSWLAHFSLFFEMADRLLHNRKILVGTDGPMRFDTWKVDGVRVETIEEEIQWAAKHLPSMKEVQMFCYHNAAEFFKL